MTAHPQLGEPCRTQGCTIRCKPNRVFCRDCRRLVTEDEEWQLRMAGQSPFWGGDAWGPQPTPAVNLVWVRERDGGARALNSPAAATQALWWVEWEQTVLAIGVNVRRRITRKAARLRLKERRR